MSVEAIAANHLPFISVLLDGGKTLTIGLANAGFFALCGYHRRAFGVCLVLAFAPVPLILALRLLLTRQEEAHSAPDAGRRVAVDGEGRSNGGE